MGDLKVSSPKDIRIAHPVETYKRMTEQEKKHLTISQKGLAHAALMAPSGGIGSHFVLHKLQGHPGIVTFEEKAFTDAIGKTLLKNFILKNQLDYRYALDQQLYPRKTIDEVFGQQKKFEEMYDEHGNSKEKTEDIALFFLNKPPLKRMRYLRVSNPYVRLFFMFRNPVSFYFTWLKKWGVYDQDNRTALTNKIPDSRVFDWFKNQYMSYLYEMSQCIVPGLDDLVSFEHFFDDTQNGLMHIYKHFPFLEDIKLEDLKTLTNCPKCNLQLTVGKKTIKDGFRNDEDVLVCPEHGPIIGEGLYNYARKEDSSFLTKWKTNPDVYRVMDRFQKIFGRDLIEYYWMEEYKKDKDMLKIYKLIADIIGRLKIEISL